ncbi:hypothetical protein EBZ35_06205 [bacterium]|nr:hypothetical protein [bacterium]
MSIGFFVSLIIEMKAKGRSRLDTHYKEQVVVFKECIKWLNLSRHWFCEHIPFWFLMMETYGIKDKNVNVLELGRFEGLSGYFILSTLPHAHLTCVDTWQGGDEYQSYPYRMSRHGVAN